MMLLARRLGLSEAVGLSIAILAPTAAMVFNVSLTARVAGRAAPLSFLIGAMVVAVVGPCLVAFARRVALRATHQGFLGDDGL